MTVRSISGVSEEGDRPHAAAAAAAAHVFATRNGDWERQIEPSSMRAGGSDVAAATAASRMTFSKVWFSRS